MADHLSGVVTDPPEDLRAHLEALHKPSHSFVDVLEWRWLELPDLLDLYTEKRPYVQPIVNAPVVSWFEPVAEPPVLNGSLRMDLYEIGNRAFYAGVFAPETGLVAFWSSPQFG